MAMNSPLAVFIPSASAPAFESLAIGAMQIANRKSLRRIVLDQSLRHRLSFVRRIIQQLNVELVQRILQPANRFQQPLHHKLLIKNRQLHRDARQLGKLSRRIGGPVLLVLVIKVDQHVAMQAIRRQQNQHNEIRNQQRHIESVGLVKPLKGFIQKMLADVLPNTSARQKQSEIGHRNNQVEQKFLSRCGIAIIVTDQFHSLLL